MSIRLYVFLLPDGGRIGGNYCHLACMIKPYLYSAMKMAFNLIRGVNSFTAPFLYYPAHRRAIPVSKWLNCKPGRLNICILNIYGRFLTPFAS